MSLPIILDANNNKYLWGLSLLMLNIGSRHLLADVGEFVEHVLANTITKMIVLFSLFFVATRDVGASLLLTLITTILLYGLLHEKSKFSLVKPYDINDTIMQYYREH
jgi:hypothetical protein